MAGKAAGRKPARPKPRGTTAKTAKGATAKGATGTAKASRAKLPARADLGLGDVGPAHRPGRADSRPGKTT